VGELASLRTALLDRRWRRGCTIAIVAATAAADDYDDAYQSDLPPLSYCYTDTIIYNNQQQQQQQDGHKESFCRHHPTYIIHCTQHTI